MSSTTGDSPPCSSSFVPHPLNVDIVAEEILSYLAVGDEEQLLNYRLVSQKWNDLIVRKFKKSERSFQIPLRYNPEIPQLIDRAVARRSANQVLESVIRTLKGTAAARLAFDTIVVGYGFYLAHGVMTKWKELLKIQGEFIHHLKLNNSRSAESTEESFPQVTDCEELISMKSLRATFSAIPALKTLDICIKLSNSDKQLLWPDDTNPRLQNLIEITLREPHGFSYDIGFLKDIFSMAPNLSALYSEPSGELGITTVATALNSMEKPHLVTTLGIENATIQDPPLRSPNILEGFVFDSLSRFSFLKLTTLELNNIFGEPTAFGRKCWINRLLRYHSSTLIKLLLGTKKSEVPNNSPLSFPPVMKTLKILEINLNEFTFVQINSYKKQFPVLQSFMLTAGDGHVSGKAWTKTQIFIHLPELLPGRSGRSNTLEEFSFMCGPLKSFIRKEFLPRIYATFPTAKYHFDS